MRTLTIILTLLISVLSLVKYSIVPVIATSDTINDLTRCIDVHNNNYLCESVTPGMGYTLIIDRHNIFNSEDNEIIYISI